MNPSDVEVVGTSPDSMTVTWKVKRFVLFSFVESNYVLVYFNFSILEIILLYAHLLLYPYVTIMIQ